MVENSVARTALLLLEKQNTSINSVSHVASLFIVVFTKKIVKNSAITYVKLNISNLLKTFVHNVEHPFYLGTIRLTPEHTVAINAIENIEKLMIGHCVNYPIMNNSYSFYKDTIFELFSSTAKSLTSTGHESILCWFLRIKTVECPPIR